VGNLPAAELARTTAWFNFMIENTVLGLVIAIIIVTGIMDVRLK